MRKITALLMIMLFVVSIAPVVIAEEADDEYQDSDVRAERRAERREEAKDRLQVAVAADRPVRADVIKARVAENATPEQRKRVARAMDNAKMLREREAFKDFKERATKARELAKERVKNARELAAKAKERAKDARQKFHDARERVHERREELAQCKNDDSEDCAELRAQARADAIEALEGAVNTAIEELNNMKARVDESEDLSEEEAQRLIAGIDAHLAELERVKSEIDALSSESSGQEIKDAAKELREVLKDIKQDAKKAAGKLVNARVGGVIVRARQLQDQLEAVLQRAENAGRDTSAVDELVLVFDEQLANAESEYESAKRLFDSDVQGAQEHLKAAHESLKDAHKTLKDIFRTLKAQGMESELEEVEDSEVVEESDDDSATEDESEDAEESEDDSDESA